MDYGSLSDVTVAAALGSNSTVNVTTKLGGTSGTSGAVNVALGANQGLSYDGGSAELFNGSDTVINSNLGDVTGGVDIGTINGSTTEFVNFKATVTCSTPSTPVTTASVTPTALPQTGADELTGLAGMAGSGAIGYGAVMYRRSKKAVADKLRNRR
jgi:LPXTG-motif cell wall-anchored protein